LVLLALGVLFGLVVREGIGGDPVPLPPQIVAAVATNPPQTVVIVLVTNTPLATALPTARPTKAATVDVHINDCDRITPTPGGPCVQPPLPTNTPRPLTECPTNPGETCIWPERDETTSREETG
jgi:hypothetical protein